MPTPLRDLTAVVRDVLHNPAIELQPEMRFDELSGSDSMDVVSIVVEAECRFGVMFEAGEVQDLVTIGDLLRQIDLKRALAAA